MDDRFALVQEDIYWTYLDPTEGREQSGRRPALVISGEQYHNIVDPLAIVVPLITTNRGWPNHVRLPMLENPSWATTEQPCTIAHRRLQTHIGTATPSELVGILAWVLDFVSLQRQGS